MREFVIKPVRRQGFWNQEELKQRESSAHLVDCIMRRVVCDASVAFRGSCVQSFRVVLEWLCPVRSRRQQV